ncbi:PadR family transcriptional regulator [Brachyspira hampsonii]|uniref:PadR family transcriptional regulator n=1 Tax=Brachyspira hampsonii TaxID=1287055 RepID=UPI000A688862|nr:PadR family transcriptional regulator [Brachyspira hampsonii]
MYIESDIIRGNIDAVVLHFLEYNDSYGYELSKLITDKTNGEYEINGQTLYSAIRRLLR